MDEFDKIRAFSRDIIGRENITPSDTEEDVSPVEEEPQKESEQAQESSDNLSSQADDGLSGLRAEYKERFGFSPIEDDFEEKKLFSMKWHIAAVSIFAGILIVVVAGFFFFGEDASSSEELITITASQNPIKVKPKDPGGIKIPDQEKVIYEHIRQEHVSTKVERLFPEPEKPVLPDTLIQDASTFKAPEVPMEAAVSPQVAEKENVQKAVKQPAVQPAPKKEVMTLPKALPKKETVPAVAQKKKETAKEEGVWHAQLLSSSNKERVEKEWPVILAKNKDLLSNMSYEIKDVNIQGRGVFYRLYVGHFKTREMAANLCQKLKANKQNCVPQK